MVRRTTEFHRDSDESDGRKRKLRSSRQESSASPAKESRKTERDENSASRTSRDIFKRIRGRVPRKLTERRREKIKSFIEESKGEPTQYGEFGSEEWIKALIQSLGESRNFVITADVREWLDEHADFFSEASGSEKEARSNSTESPPSSQLNFSSSSSKQSEDSPDQASDTDASSDADLFEPVLVTRKKIRSKDRINDQPIDKQSDRDAEELLSMLQSPVQNSLESQVTGPVSAHSEPQERVHAGMPITVTEMKQEEDSGAHQVPVSDSNANSFPTFLQPTPLNVALNYGVFQNVSNPVPCSQPNELTSASGAIQTQGVVPVSSQLNSTQTSMLFLETAANAESIPTQPLTEPTTGKSSQQLFSASTEQEIMEVDDLPGHENVPIIPMVTSSSGTSSPVTSTSTAISVPTSDTPFVYYNQTSAGNFEAVGEGPGLIFGNADQITGILRLLPNPSLTNPQFQIDTTKIGDLATSDLIFRHLELLKAMAAQMKDKMYEASYMHEAQTQVISSLELITRNRLAQ